MVIRALFYVLSFMLAVTLVSVGITTSPLLVLAGLGVFILLFLSF